MSDELLDLRTRLRGLVTQHKLERIQQILEQRSRFVSFVFEDFYHDHNIHAAMRSIECCGFQDVHIIEDKKNHEDSLTITKGADYWLSEYYYNQPAPTNTQSCFDALKDQGYTLVGATPDTKAHLLHELPLETKVAIVFGNERLGISDYAHNHVDTYVTIPMYGFTQSFNASVSAALVAYQLRQRLQHYQGDWLINQQEKADLELIWLKRIVRASAYM